MDNFKAAARSLLSTPGPTLVVLATLAIAIGANTAIFSVVNGVLLRSLGFGDEDQLVVLWQTNEAQGLENSRFSMGDYRDVRDSAAAFDGQVAMYRYVGFTMTALERPARVSTLIISPRVFSVLQAGPEIGRVFGEADEKPGSEKQVVLTHASWTRRFGADPEIVGTTIELDSQPYTVIGVSEEGFQFPPGDDRVEMYTPLTLDEGVLLDRAHRMFDTVARLSDGASVAAANDEVGAIAERLDREFSGTNEGWGMRVRPLRAEVLGDVGTTLWVLSAAVFLVLLIACANIANVLVARSSATAREFAVRAALGARAGDLAQRSLAESLLLGLFGGTGGLLLALWGVALLRRVMPAEVPRGAEISLDATVLLFAAALSIGASVLFGMLPAVRSMSPNLAELLKPAGASGVQAAGGRRLRELMVIVEVALAIVLLVGAGLMVRSFSRLNDVDPGFRQDGVVAVAVELPRSRYQSDDMRTFFKQLVTRVADLPGVKGAGAVSDLPMSEVGVAFEMSFSVLGLDALAPTVRPNADFRTILPGYIEAMGIELVSGRSFDRLDGEDDRKIALVNETLVERYFTDIDPIGQMLRMPMAGDLEIVGVVADIRHGGLQSEFAPELFIPHGQLPLSEMHIVVYSDLEPGAAAAAVSDVLADMDPQLAPTAIVTIADLLWESVAQPRFNTALLAALAACAAVLAIVGTYGIVAYTVTQRTGEIGVRMALGADSAATVLMIVRQALGIVLLGALVGLVGAFGVTRFLTQLLFGIRPTDPLTYGLVLVAAVVVGALAAWMPARRATRIDPVSALRED